LLPFLPTARKGPSRRYLEAIGNQQNTAEALEHLTRLPEGPEVHELLGFAYRAQHRDTESAQEFHRALQLQPANFRLRKEWAVSLWLSGNCSAAERAIKPLLGTNPTSPQLSHVMGDCLVKENEPEAALPLLTTVLKRDPAFFPAEASLGRAYMHLGRYRDAIPHLKKALVLNDRLTLYQLAQAYKKSVRTRRRIVTYANSTGIRTQQIAFLICWITQRLPHHDRREPKDSSECLSILARKLRLKIHRIENIRSIRTCCVADDEIFSSHLSMRLGKRELRIGGWTGAKIGQHTLQIDF
jgi:tetratricopeptide (TPR) repeat protein